MLSRTGQSSTTHSGSSSWSKAPSSTTVRWSIAEAGHVRAFHTGDSRGDWDVHIVYADELRVLKEMRLLPQATHSQPACIMLSGLADELWRFSYPATGDMESGAPGYLLPRHQFVGGVRDDHITTEPITDGALPIQEIIIRPVPEGLSCDRWRNEEAHIIVNVPPELVPVAGRGRENTPDLGRRVGCSIFRRYPQRCRAGDVRVRQALNYAVD